MSKNLELFPEYHSTEFADVHRKLMSGDFLGAANSIETHPFQSSAEKNELRSLQGDLSHIAFLVDYEFLGSNSRGLDLISEFNISQQSILVTSHHEEDEIKQRASTLKLKILPKSMAAIVPIRP